MVDAPADGRAAVMAATGETEARSRLRTRVGIVALSCGTVMIFVDGNIANAALPTMSRLLAISEASSVSIVTIYQYVLVVALLPFSALGHRIGLRRLYQSGQVLLLSSSWLVFVADDLAGLIACRTLQALGAAASLSVMTALLRHLYAPAHLGRGLGFNASVISVAAVVAPAAGGVMLSFASWPWLFVVATPFGLLSLLLGRYLPDVPPKRVRFDFAGAALTAITLMLIVGGFDDFVRRTSELLSFVMVAAGIAMGLLLVRHERTQAEPVLPVDLLLRPTIAVAELASFAAFVAWTLILVSLPFRLQGSFGMSAIETGALLAAWPMTTVFVAPLIGIASDRLPIPLLGAFGASLTITALAAMVFMPADAGFIDFAWRIALCGAGLHIFVATNHRFVLAAAPQHRAAAAGGMISTIRLCGQAFGATLVAGLLHSQAGAGAAPSIIAGFLMFFAGICGLTRLRKN